MIRLVSSLGNPGHRAAGSPRAILEFLFERLPPGRVLNLGCGRTSYDSSLRLSIDVDRNLPEGGSRRGRFVLADAAQLPFRAGAFDGALLKDVLEHTVEPVNVLSEVRRTCNRDSRIVVTVPRAIPRAVWADFTHLRGFTAGALLGVLEGSGWSPIGSPRRLGGFPGAGRLGLEKHLVQVMRLPILGHRLGTNWIIDALRKPGGSSTCGISDRSHNRDARSPGAAGT